MTDNSLAAIAEGVKLGPDDNVRDLAHHIKINVDGDLRSALHTALAASPSASTGKDGVVKC